MATCIQKKISNFWNQYDPTTKGRFFLESMIHFSNLKNVQKTYLEMRLPDNLISR